MYAKGEGVEKNDNKAVELYKKACVGGEAMGYFYLGGMHANGYGVKKNKTRAKEYYKRACDGQIEKGCEAFEKLIDKSDPTMIKQS